MFNDDHYILIGHVVPSVFEEMTALIEPAAVGERIPVYGRGCRDCGRTTMTAFFPTPEGPKSVVLAEEDRWRIDNPAAERIIRWMFAVGWRQPIDCPDDP